MDDLEKRLEEKLAYLYEMAKKYNNLNQKTNNRYDWRENAINEHIQALEELKDINTITGTWDECFEEDFIESNR